MADGYRGWQRVLAAVSDEAREEFAYEPGSIASTGELQLLIDGRRSALDIKHALDAQYPNTSDLQAVLNYLEILELAGLIEK